MFKVIRSSKDDASKKIIRMCETEERAVKWLLNYLHLDFLLGRAEQYSNGWCSDLFYNYYVEAEA